MEAGIKEAGIETSGRGIKVDDEERIILLRIKMLTEAGSGHPGGALAEVDIQTVLRYGGFFRERPEDPQWEDRDRFIQSNGHACPILYTILADKGYFPKEELRHLRKLGAMLQGHPSTSKRVPGIELSGGSLGNGLSYSCGISIAGRLKKKDYRTYCMISDGECQEGQTWEAALFAAHHKLDNLTVILDRNGTQIDGHTEDIIRLEPLDKKWKAFGWHTILIKGHNYPQITSAFEEALSIKGKPAIIIAYTITGKGVSFMEGDYHWHHGAPTKEQLEVALNRFDKEKNNLLKRLKQITP